MDKVSVIIVNWNTGSLLRACLTAIAQLPEQDSIRHVIVIDNASKDDSIAQAQEVAHEHGYTIIQEKYNLGFAKANNLGWKYILQHDGENDHILLLNPDTEIAPHAISHMVSTFKKNPRVGIVGPKLLEPNGNIQPSVRAFPTLTIFILVFLKLHLLFYFLPAWKRYIRADFDYEKEQIVDQVMGAAFLIRNEVITKIGLLDESFWIWLEEVDFCKRAKQIGFDTLYTPGAHVLHYGGVSFHQLVGLSKTKPLLTSFLVYTKKHLGFLSYVVLCALYPLGIAIAAAASVAHIQQKKYNAKRL